MQVEIYLVFLLAFVPCNSCLLDNSTITNTTNTSDLVAKPGWRVPCKEPTSLRGICVATILITIIVVGIIGNVIVIAGILYTPSLRVQVTSHFIVSLAVADILIPSLVLPFRVMIELHNGDFCLSEIACKIVVFLSTFFDVASITNIFMISIDRFTAIVLPLSYTRIMSEKRVTSLITMVWLYSAIWAGLGFFDWRYPHKSSIKLSRVNPYRCNNDNMYYFIVVYVTVFIVPLIAIGFMYLVILNAAMKQIRTIGTLEIDERENAKKSARRRRMKHLQSMKSVSCVYGAFLVCWLPNCVITIHSSLNGMWWRSFREKHSTEFYVLYYTFAQILPPLNCALNPFIYTLLHRNFRTAFKAALLRMIGRRMDRRYTETSFRKSHEMQNVRNGNISPADSSRK